jgi:hypothetical protein
MLALFTIRHPLYSATFAGYMGRSRVRIAPPIAFIGRFEARARGFGLFGRPDRLPRPKRQWPVTAHQLVNLLQIGLTPFSKL